MMAIAISVLGFFGFIIGLSVTQPIDLELDLLYDYDNSFQPCGGSAVPCISAPPFNGLNNYLTNVLAEVAANSISNVFEYPSKNIDILKEKFRRGYWANSFPAGVSIGYKIGVHSSSPGVLNPPYSVFCSYFPEHCCVDVGRCSCLQPDHNHGI